MTEYLFSKSLFFFKFTENYYFELSKSIILINNINEYTITGLVIALGFFISLLCPLLWIYNLINTADFKQSLKTSPNRTWIFEKSKYGFGGDLFFPGSALLAEILLYYRPEFPKAPTYIVNLSNSVKNPFLLDDLLKYIDACAEKELLSDFDQLNLESQEDEDFFNYSSKQLKSYFEDELAKEQESRDLADVAILRKTLVNLEQIKRFTSNWSLVDFYISLTVRVVIREIYPNFSDLIDENIVKLHEKPYLWSDLKSFTKELLCILKEKELKEKFGKQKPRLSSNTWFFIFQFIILNYKIASAENKPLVLYNKIRTDFIELLKTNNFLEEQKILVRSALFRCINTNLLTNFFLVEEKQAQGFKETLWQSEILFHSMSLFNVSSEKEVSVKLKELLTTTEIKKKQEQEFQFYREGLILSFEMAGISKNKSLKVIDEALKTKDKELLLTFLGKIISSHS